MIGPLILMVSTVLDLSRDWEVEVESSCAAVAQKKVNILASTKTNHRNGGHLFEVM